MIKKLNMLQITIANILRMDNYILCLEYCSRKDIECLQNIEHSEFTL
jgi:hypothetical protein